MNQRKGIFLSNDRLSVFAKEHYIINRCCLAHLKGLRIFSLVLENILHNSFQGNGPFSIPLMFPGGIDMWIKVFKKGLIKICGRQPLKYLEGFKFFKGCLPQILLGPFLNNLSHVTLAWHGLIFLEFLLVFIATWFLRGYQVPP